jgi:RNA polymerase sigma-70 factor (ECF subfamily)
MNDARFGDLQSLDEAGLIARVLGGERAAFRPLVEAYEPAVFGLCRQLLDGNAAEAEDLSQETFLRAFRRLGELKDRTRFGPWLYQIARSLCRDKVRSLLAERRALERRLDLQRWRAAGEPADPDVSSVLASLPAAERHVLELRYFKGLSYREMAEVMDLSLARVDHLIRQARARLGRFVERARRQRERSL